MRRRVGGVLSLLALALPCVGGYLEEGNKEYLSGNYDKAIALYEKDDSRENLLTRKFNCGVAYLRKGNLDEALKRFEEVSVKSQGKLRKASLFNLGYVYFQKGKKAYEKSLKSSEKKDTEDQLKALFDSAQHYRNALDAFRRIGDSTERVRQAIGKAKIALLGVLDEIRRIQEEKEKKREEELLKDPPELLRELIKKERKNRTLARFLVDQPGRVLRLSCRTLKKAEEKGRELSEALLNFLQNPPEEKSTQKKGGAQKGKAKGPYSLGEEERKRAIQSLARAIACQKEAEAAYARRSPAEAVPNHNKAIEAFRFLRTLFPLNLQQVVQEGIDTQSSIISATEQLKGEAEEEKKPKSLGDQLLDVLKDSVLKPIARLLSPEAKRNIAELRDQEKGVVWVGQVLSRVKEKAEGSVSTQGKTKKQNLEKERKILEVARKEGKACVEFAQKASLLLEKGALEASLKPQREALDCLKRIAELFPKPPKSPLERLRELVKRQKEARKLTEEIEELSGDSQNSACLQLSKKQRYDGKEASEIAKVLSSQRNEAAQEASKKVKEGTEHIYASAEALDRIKVKAARDSIDQAIKSLSEALALLSGKRRSPPEGLAQKRTPQKQGSKRGDKNKKEEKRKAGYRLTPELAKLKREEMDRKRKEEEAKLLVGPSKIVVDKDW